MDAIFINWKFKLDGGMLSTLYAIHDVFFFILIFTANKR